MEKEKAKKKKVMFNLSEDIATNLKLYAVKNKKSMSSIVEELIQQLLTTQQKEV